MPEISLLVEGGKATAGPPLGPSLAPLGVNIGAIVGEINNKTKDFVGIKVPVKVNVDSATKKFEIKVGSPPTSSLIRKELGISKGSGDQHEHVANLTLEQVKKLAEMKSECLNSTDPKKMQNEIIGTANSMGVTIEGLSGKNYLRQQRGEELIEEQLEVEEETYELEAQEQKVEAAKVEEKAEAKSDASEDKKS